LSIGIFIFIFINNYTLEFLKSLNGMKPQFAIVAFAIILSSCAGSYKRINPPGITYLSKSVDKSVTLEYQYNVLPSKYAKNEVESDIKLLAIKITNNSGHDIILGKDARLYFTDTSRVQLVDKKYAFTHLKQQSGFYLLYLAITTIVLNIGTGSEGSNSFIPIGYVVGPGLAVGNFAVASSVNGRFKKELNKYYIDLGTKIKKDSTVYGLVGINTWKYEALSLKVD
jgi:type 1 fimbria pilin